MTNKPLLLVGWAKRSVPIFRPLMGTLRFAHPTKIALTALNLAPFNSHPTTTKRQGRRRPNTWSGRTSRFAQPEAACRVSGSAFRARNGGSNDKTAGQPFCTAEGCPQGERFGVPNQEWRPE